MQNNLTTSGASSHDACRQRVTGGTVPWHRYQIKKSINKRTWLYLLFSLIKKARDASLA